MDPKRKAKARYRRHLRVRRRVVGTPDQPRLVVFRSNRHIYAQVIDDTAGRTLAAASSLDSESGNGVGATAAAARSVGELLGRRAVEQGISRVVFDRAGYQYHGRVQALADGARESGLEF